jgi:2-desacetyl-2-hydroxyethyl bacteriochlorophyllide A dehydrogenase
LKALVWEAPKTMMIRDTPVPDIASDEVLVKVSYAGICGSELSGYLGHNALRVPPLVMGHEFSGIVVSLGKEVKQFKEGQAVTVNPLSCKEDSELQKRGLDHLCPSRVLLGAHRPGAYAEYVAVPGQSVLVLPEGVNLRRGALTEPVGCAVRIGELAGDVAGQTCLIIGAGPIGLLSLQILQRKGAAQVFVADLDLERLAMAGKLGADMIDPSKQNTVSVVKEATGNRGVPIAVDAVGSAVTRAQCISATMPTGTVILSGLHEESSLMPVADVIRREITLKGSFAYSPANFAAALDLLAAGAIHLDPWIVEAPLAEGGQWFERLLSVPGNVSKVLLVP